MMVTTCKEQVEPKRDSITGTEKETLQILLETRKILCDFHRSIYGDCPTAENGEEPQCLAHNVVINNQIAKSILDEIMVIREHF